ncbi:MAG: L-threonylcarbamoyladenylate synthase [Clostridiales bacterium]|nr:L-threonylcarbamoyladenylate synthase [Clostridiales bacterium]
MKTQVFSGTAKGAAEIIRNGGLVAVPTETVYGLAGSGLNEQAVGMIYEVKGRPAVKPLSLMVHGSEAMDALCLDVPEQARTLAARFWPGPLTIVLNAKSEIPSIVLAGGSTVGLRCPDHPLTLELLRDCGLPLAAPSANPSGEESPKDAGKVLEYFDGKINAVIDGGRCGLGRESTIIDMSKSPYRILRQGALPAEDIADALVGGMKVIGITGGTGCGKTTALNVLRDMGALVIDCDAVYHELLASSSEMLAEIAARFPGTVEHGALQRKKLGAVVFDDAQALEDLNAITHRYVCAEVDRRLRDWARMGGRLAAIDAIALIESGLAERCGVVLGVTAPREARIGRLMAREGISRAYAEARIDAQKPNEWFGEHCDRVLENSGSLDQFQKTCKQVIQEVLA